MWGARVTLGILDLINLPVAVVVAVVGLTIPADPAESLAGLEVGWQVVGAPVEMAYATVLEDLVTPETQAIRARRPILVAAPYLEVFLVDPVALEEQVASAILAVLEAVAVAALGVRGDMEVQQMVLVLRAT